MDSIVDVLQRGQREADLAEIDSQRVGVRTEAKVGPGAGKGDQALLAVAREQDREDAAALAARQPASRWTKWSDTLMLPLATSFPPPRRLTRGHGQRGLATARERIVA